MPQNLFAPLSGAGEPSRAVSSAQATAEAIGLRFGSDHPATAWARMVAERGANLLNRAGVRPEDL